MHIDKKSQSRLTFGLFTADTPKLHTNILFPLTQETTIQFKLAVAI